MKKTVLITGASSGFGFETAKLFQKNNWNVIATMRYPQNDTPLLALPNVLVTKLDVVDTPSIAKAVAAGIEKFGGIDVLINNAGYGTLGVLEAASDEEVRKQFDVNVFGLIAVTKAVLPAMRKNRTGLIINISSLGGRITFPYFSLYHATKFAVEGLSEALQYELNPLGIGVKLIEPGGYKTNFSGSSMGFFGIDHFEEYKDGFHQFTQVVMQSADIENKNIAEVAEKIFEAATDGTDQLRYPVGAGAIELLEAKQKMDDATFKHMLAKQMGLKL
jgi:NAD(P)-dependent dehydrogenase (short-subunit alcohol dehydrogenase family)